LISQLGDLGKVLSYEFLSVLERHLRDKQSCLFFICIKAFFVYKIILDLKLFSRAISFGLAILKKFENLGFWFHKCMVV